MSGSIDDFFAESLFAVAGASANREKYGNQILRAFIRSGRQVVPLNPRAEEIEGVASYPSLNDLGDVPGAVSIVTPPAATALVIDQAIECGVRSLWIQPGAEHEGGITKALSAGLNVIADGRCILVSFSREQNRS